MGHKVVKRLQTTEVKAHLGRIVHDVATTGTMEIPVIYIFTHDSIGVGEDGPTHQPVEQLTSLRTIPGLITLRPADANEVVEAWRVIMRLHHEPAALVLSRQPLPTLDRSTDAPPSGLAQGAYVLADAGDGQPDVILIASGSEVVVGIEAYEQLKAEGIKVRMVSMPSGELFEQQSQEYRDKILPPEVTARVSVEQASSLGWERYVGPTGQSIGMKTFGTSAPLKELQRTSKDTRIRRSLISSNVRLAPSCRAWPADARSYAKRYEITPRNTG